MNASGGELASAEIYDPAVASFDPTGPLTAPRFNFTLTRLDDGRVLTAGGQ